MHRQSSETVRSTIVPFSPPASKHTSMSSLAAPPMSSSSSLRFPQNRKSIYDRHLNRSKTSELSKASFAFLFGEMVGYAQKRVAGIQDLEKKLNAHGYMVGQRLLELLNWREGRSAKRETRILGVLQFITTTVWTSVFNKAADALEKSREKEDEYMISDNEPIVNTYISIPKEMGSLNCAAFQAGIIEAVLDGYSFPCNVTAHSVVTEQFPQKTVFLIKFDQKVLDREAQLGAST